MEISKSDNDGIEIHEQVQKIIEKLKLVKSGHINIISEFEFTDDLECIPISHSYPSKNRNYKKYFFEEGDIIDFGRLKKYFEQPKSYLELALNSFFESYNIENEKLRFVMLMICLESIFIDDETNDKIANTLSTNTALIITKDRNEFDKIKDRIQKILYDLRSRIVHGDKLSNKHKKRLKCILIYISNLEEIVRNVLRELILNNKYSEIVSKKQLRNYLKSNNP